MAFPATLASIASDLRTRASTTRATAPTFPVNHPEDLKTRHLENLEASAAAYERAAEIIEHANGVAGALTS
jgi:hypothetical protein